MIGRQLQEAKLQFEEKREAARVFSEFFYQTRKTWKRERRLVAKAEYLEKGANPRFVVTSLGVEQFAAQALYEGLYCARGTGRDGDVKTGAPGFNISGGTGSAEEM